ncbi:MAG: hypothetical protein A2052_05995 [Deltaproteobacteria bacterium GWA2_54_12]|nr:MAG: hypothetical protein A2052_05995 [Deltaproteobacteria bacterium GWA2_54_12]
MCSVIRLLKNSLITQSMDGLPNCETEIEQFIRFGRIHFGQIVLKRPGMGFFNIRLKSGRLKADMI